MKRNLFARRQYVALAQAIARVRAFPSDCPREALRDLQEEIADLLTRDNPKFDRGRFAEACKPQAAIQPHANGYQHKARHEP